MTTKTRKFRIFTENGDILFYGIKNVQTPSRPRFTDGIVVSFYGSPQQHVELTEHLNRHDRSWIFTDRRAYDEGLVHYDLPPYFKFEEVDADASETDSAVNGVLPNPKHDRMCSCNTLGTSYAGGAKQRRTHCPDQTYFPAEHTADPYTAVIDFDFVFEGERFRSEETRGGKKIVRYGTFAMDGHAVSPNYGWLKAEEEGDTRTAEAKRNAYDAARPGSKPYINVHYDDRPAGYYTQKTGERAFLPNEGLEFGKGIVIYGLPEVAKRKRDMQTASLKARQRRLAEAKVADAKRQIADAKDALARAESLLADLDK